MGRIVDCPPRLVNKAKHHLLQKDSVKNIYKMLKFKKWLIPRVRSTVVKE